MIQSLLGILNPIAELGVTVFPEFDKTLVEVDGLVRLAQAFVNFGPNLPVQEIALAATKKDAKAILLSIVYPQDDPFLGDELARLRTMLQNGTAVIVGGRAARSYSDVLQTSRSIILDDLMSLRRQLERLRGNA